RGERRVVGGGLHRVNHRDAGETPLRGPPAAAPSRRPGLLRPAGARGARRAGRPGAPLRHLRLLSLLLLVRRPPAARAPPRRDARERPSRLPALFVLGQRELAAALGGPGAPSVDGR